MTTHEMRENNAKGNIYLLKGETSIEACRFALKLFEQLAISVNVDKNGRISIPFTRLLVHNYMDQFDEFEALLNSRYADNAVRCLVKFLQENNEKERIYFGRSLTG
jgi:hypothetical protein